MDTTFNILQGNSTETCYTLLGNHFEWYERYPIICAGGLAGFVILPLILPICLFILGFTCYGIMAGSAAACCQSSIGNVEAGSCFSCAQSAGAGGCSRFYIFLVIVMALIGAGIGGYLTFLDTQPCTSRRG